MITPDDVGKLIGDRTEDVSNYAAAVPGGTFFDRGPDDPAAYPYMIFKLEFGELVTTSGPLSTQNVRVRAATYSAPGAGNPQTVALALFECFGTQAANLAIIGTAMRNGNDKPLSCRPAISRGEFDKTLRNGQDVFLCGLTFDILFQGDRGSL